MMKYEDSASFVYSIAKRARKYYLGLTTATQDVEDFLKTEYGKAVLTNSSVQILLKQGTAEVDIVGETFFLSEGERELLLAADVGEGLFFAGKNHVAMKVIAAPFEHQLITSNPEELMKRQQAQQQQAQVAPKIPLPTMPQFQAPPPTNTFKPPVAQATPSAQSVPSVNVTQPVISTHPAAPVSQTTVPSQSTVNTQGAPASPSQSPVSPSSTKNPYSSPIP